MWAKRQYQHQQRMWNKRWDTDTKHLFLISMNHHRFGSVRFGFSSVLVLALVFWFGSVWLKRNSATSSMTACLALKTEDRRRENGERRIRGAENGKPRTETTQNKLKECTKSRRRSKRNVRKKRYKKSSGGIIHTHARMYLQSRAPTPPTFHRPYASWQR